MNAERITAIRAKCEAATPGEWKDDRRLDGVPTVHNGEVRVCDTFRRDGQSVLDAEFIAHARTDIPALLVEVERLTEQLAASQRREQAMMKDIPIAVHHHQGCCSICKYAVWDDEMEKWLCTTFAKWPRHECFDWRGLQEKTIYAEWKNNTHDYPECTVCSYMPMFDPHLDDIYYSPYCPNCGAKMKGE